MASVNDLITLSRAQAGVYDGPDSGVHTGGGFGKVLGKIFGLPDPEEEKRKMEKTKKQIDMYRTLRQSGYDPKSAHKAVVNATEFPAEPGGATIEEQKAQRDIKSRQILDEKRTKENTILDERIKNGPRTLKPAAVLEQIKNKIATGGFDSLTVGEQKVYNDNLRKSGGNSLSAILAKSAEASAPKPAAPAATKPAKLQDQILEKVAASGYDSLSAGEKKVYDDVIKKQPAGSGGGGTKSGKVAVFDPQGNPGFVPADKLQKALSKGYKLR